MPPDKPTGYWLITTQYKHCLDSSTRAIKKHPAEYIAKHLRDESLIYAMPITKQQYTALDRAYKR